MVALLFRNHSTAQLSDRCTTAFGLTSRAQVIKIFSCASLQQAYVWATTRPLNISFRTNITSPGCYGISSLKRQMATEWYVNC